MEFQVKMTKQMERGKERKFLQGEENHMPLIERTFKVPHRINKKSRIGRCTLVKFPKGKRNVLNSGEQK